MVNTRTYVCLALVVVILVSTVGVCLAAETHRITLAASAQSGQSRFMGPIEVRGSQVITQVRHQRFVPEAGLGVWRIPYGEVLTFVFELPREFRDVDVAIQELGWLNAPPDGRVYLYVNQDRQAIVVPSTPEKTLQVHRPAQLAARLKPGRNLVQVANNNPSGDLGIQEFVLSYAVPLPQARIAAAPDEARLTLLSPLPQQIFSGNGQGILIAWQAEHFPPHAGVRIHYREGQEPWRVVPGAEALPFNTPAGHGTRGWFLWRPPPAVAALTFGLSYVEQASTAAPTLQPQVVNEVKYWLSIYQSDKPADFERYLEQFPDGQFADLARLRLRALRKEQALAVGNEQAFWLAILRSTDPADFQAYLEHFPHGHFVDLAQMRLRALQSK